MEVLVGRRYRHFKGMIVEVICIAKDSETLQEMVVYKEENNGIWVRSYDMFVSLVDKQKYPDVDSEYRFTLIEE